MKFDSIIVGAGISGLVAGRRLKKAGRGILLLESSDRAGGVIQTIDAQGFLIEKGPNSFRGTHEFLDLIEELELTAELITADPRAPAYVYADGNLQAVPMSPPALIKTKLISGPAKLRLLREPFIKARVEKDEESIASFVRRRLGDQILDRIVAPFLSGVYAGDPAALSVQACFPRLAQFENESGSVIRGAIKALRSNRKEQSAPKRSLRPYRLCSFKNGLQTLIDRLREAIGDNPATEAKVIKIEKSSGGFTINFERHGERKSVEAENLIISSPALAAAKLIEGIAPELSQLLVEIPYVPLASVPLAYEIDQVARKLDGFGFLAPRSEGLRTLGSIWNSSLFAGRAPEGWVCTTNFIGGATDIEAVALDDDELIGAVHRDLSKVLGIKGEPRRLPITRYDRAIPQYNPGHAARVAKIESALHNHKGLWLAGNYLRGVALGDCIKHADQIALQIVQNERPN